MERKTLRVIRGARIGDVPRMAQIINGYAKDGTMLPRSLSRIYEQLRDYAVAEADGEIVGCGALHVTWEDLGEIRSLAIAEEHWRQGIGSEIVGFLEGRNTSQGFFSIPLYVCQGVTLYYLLAKGEFGRYLACLRR